MSKFNSKFLIQNGSIVVVFFSCNAPMASNSVGLFNLPVEISNIIHCAGAVVLFIAYGINIFFLFTLGLLIHLLKQKRNKAYRVCGMVIFSFCLIQALTLTPLFAWIPDWFPLTWFNEFFILEAVAMAWLVKAESISFLNDQT